jgi:hypothetical protein
MKEARRPKANSILATEMYVSKVKGIKGNVYQTKRD